MTHITPDLQATLDKNKEDMEIGSRTWMAVSGALAGVAIGGGRLGISHRSRVLAGVLGVASSLVTVCVMGSEAQDEHLRMSASFN